jgi:MFS family permease
MSKDEEPSALRQSLPVLMTSLVNKAGSIGVSLFPMLLVEAHFTTAQSSWSLGLVKAATLVATLASGWAGDTIGLRTTLLGSFLLAGLGLAVMPASSDLVLITLSGVVAQLGITSVNSTTRMLLTRTVARKHQKEALGWMRTVNNLGQILSFSLATASAGLGAKLLIWFDALTSLLAFGLGWKVLPRPQDEAQGGASKLPAGRGSAHGWWPFVGAALVVAGWSFLYELFSSGVAGKLKVLDPAEGLRTYSMMFVVNTVLCAGLAVQASRWLKRAVPTLAVGMSLVVLGVSLAIWRTESLGFLFAGMLALTLGEVMCGVFSQFLLIRSTPAHARENSIYAGAILVANLARVGAAALSFPWVVRASSPTGALWMVWGVGVLIGAILLLGRRRFSQIADAE